MLWFWVVVLVAVIGAIAVVAAGRGDSMAEVYGDRPDTTVPAERPLTADDLRAVRFNTGVRGYRMDEVDALLARLEAEALDREDDADEPHPHEAESSAVLMSDDNAVLDLIRDGSSAGREGLETGSEPGGPVAVGAREPRDVVEAEPPVGDGSRTAQSAADAVGADAGRSDAGPADAGRSDAGRSDAGRPVDDAAVEQSPPNPP